MSVVVFLLLSYLLCFVYGQDLIFKNSCPFDLWADGRGENNDYIPGETNPLKFLAANGGTANWTMPDEGLASTRFWAKFGCDSNGANCLTGDTVPNYILYPNGGCPSGGCSPPLDSLFEATWGCKLGSGCPSTSTPTTWFDTSQVDGFTLPYRVIITGNTQCDCDSSGACNNLTLIDASRLDISSCPTAEDLSYYGKFIEYAHEDLRYIKNSTVVACKSPCKQLTLPLVQSGLALEEGSAQAEYYCCPTPNPNNCQPADGCITPQECRAGPVVDTQYVDLIHKETDQVYAYTYDDLVGLHTCPAANVQYTMEYCPPGSPAYPAQGTTSSSSSGSASSSSSSSSSSSGSTTGAPAPCTLNCGSLSCCSTLSNGPLCYNPSQETCAYNGQNGNELCTLGDSACGEACYSPSQYKCVNGNLEPVTRKVHLI